MSDFTILSIPQSNFGRSIGMLAYEKGLTFDYQTERPHSEAVKALNPFGKIPAFKHGDTEIYETSAIARYVDAVFEGPKFFPSDPLAAARVEQWISLHNLFDQTMIRQYALGYAFPGTEDGKPDRPRIEGALDALEKQLKMIEAELEADFLVGDDFTYADMALYPTLHYMTQFPESKKMLAVLPKLSAYIDRIAARDSAKKTAMPS